MSRLVFRPERRAVVVPIVIALNVLVFCAWHVPSLEPFMEATFLVSWTALTDGRAYTLLTSVFSHATLFHLFVNMFVLNSFGSFVEIVLGRARFLRFYLFAGVIASLTHAFVSAFVLGDPGLPALGASGAIAGVILLFALLFPREKILLLGFVPVPAIAGAIFAVLLDLWGLYGQARGGGLPIGHGAHLGGALAGLIYFLLLFRGRRRI